MGTATVIGLTLTGTLLEAAFIALLLLLLGDMVYAHHRARGSVSHVEPKRTRMERLREKPWNVRVALLLVAVWAVWLLAFVAWGWTIPEWQDGNFYFGYTVMSVAALVPVVIGCSVVASVPLSVFCAPTCPRFAQAHVRGSTAVASMMSKASSICPRLARNASGRGRPGSELGYAPRVTARCSHGSSGSPNERCTATSDSSSRKVTSRAAGAHVPNPEAQKMNFYSRVTLLV